MLANLKNNKKLAIFMFLLRNTLKSQSKIHSYCKIRKNTIFILSKRRKILFLGSFFCKILAKYLAIAEILHIFVPNK